MRRALLLLAALSPLAALAACEPGGKPPPRSAPPVQPAWLPHSYSAVYSEDGSQRGWLLREFRFEAGPPAERQLADGTVEIPLELEVEQRETFKELGWVPPQGVPQSHSL